MATGTRMGTGMRETKGMGYRQVRVRTRMRIRGWGSPRQRLQGWWVTWWWSATERGRYVPGRPAPCRPRSKSSQGKYKETDTMCSCRHPNLQCMFHLPFIHTLLFVSLVCSSVIPVTCFGGVPAVFRSCF